MKNFCREDFKNCGHKVLCALAGVLILFLGVLTVSAAVGISNKIKEGRYIGQEIESKNTITVSGQAEVYAKPDLALVVFSVVTEAKTVAQAMTQNTSKMNAVIDSAKGMGVEEKDLKTTSFNIYQRYEYRTSGLYPSGNRVLVGYEVSQSLQVKIRDLEKIGQIIEEATDAGANQVGNLQFTIDDQDALKAQVREEAIKSARAKAEKIADELGVSLVRIVGFSENLAAVRYDYALKAEAMGGGGEVPQIETGENKVETTVSVVYEIN
ncbi:SIMPL domain-containing protein [Patescibacteria group bacterium]|nr:SIMPL domain-containing protein [Patescibacteria group bacterium]